MKQTLLILVALISINCFGQGGFFLNDSTIRGNIIEWLTEEEMQEQYMYASNYQLYLAWEKYSVECYNDSTLFERSHYLPEGEYGCTMTLMLPYESNYCTKETHYRKYWMHKPTNGFLGFMEWLKTKYE